MHYVALWQETLETLSYTIDIAGMLCSTNKPITQVQSGNKIYQKILKKHHWYNLDSSSNYTVL